ncbi:hypothetical protein [Coleofasciculus sp.]|uniref:hypothetical protein n=1 Tax=Coleofasciculus sp. TaxID=3100458 RepID=UPI0039FA6769
MDLTNLLNFLNQAIDSIVKTSPDKVIDYVDNIRSANPKLSKKEIATKIVDEQSLSAVTGFGFDWFSTKAIGKLAIEFYEKRPELMK